MHEVCVYPPSTCKYLSQGAAAPRVFLTRNTCFLFYSGFSGWSELSNISCGITNSGRPHTIQGSQDDPGIIPRVLDSMFASLCLQVGSLSSGEERIDH